MKKYLVLILLLVQVPLRAANPLIVGSVTILTNLTTLGFRAAYTGDDNANATMTVRFKLSSGTTWYTAYPPIVDRRATVPIPGGSNVSNTANQFQARGSIVGLLENTSYDVETTWVDSDGVTGTNPTTTTVLTATSTPTATGASYFVNSATGNNSNSGTTSGSPWLTLAFAYANTSAGSIINCNGTFAGGLTISVNGTPGAYRKLQAQSGQSCSLSAGSANTITITGNYIWVTGITIGASTTGSGIEISGPRHHIVLDHLTIPNFVTSEGSTQGAFNGGIALTSDNIHDVLILNNSITRTAVTCTQNGVDGVTFSNSGYYNVVVDHNTITGGTWDGIGNGSNSSTTNLENVDYSNNVISNYFDDGIEMDGGGINLRVWGNTTSSNQSCGGGGNTGLSEAGTEVGPSYVFRNYLTSSLGTLDKGGRGVGYSFFFHNTMVDTRSGAGYSDLTQEGGTPLTQNHVYRNNIYIATVNSIFQQEGPRPGNDYDYDIAFCSGSCGGVNPVDRWNNVSCPSGCYATWALFVAATGMEDFGGTQVNGIFGNPNLDGSYHITTSSNAHDKAVVLANFNDQNSAWPYTDSAPDVGAFETTDVVNPAISITAPAGCPAFTTSSNTLTTLAGTASDDNSVASVTWTNDRGGSGPATGTTSWSIPTVTLFSGVNVVTVTARDPSNNSASSVCTVTYNAVPPQGYYATVVLADTPTGYYRLDEPIFGSGTLTDYSGNSRNGVYNGTGTEFLFNQFGLADTVDTSVLFQNLGAIAATVTVSAVFNPVGTNSWTIETWIKPISFVDIGFPIALMGRGWTVSGRTNGVFLDITSTTHFPQITRCGTNVCTSVTGATAFKVGTTYYLAAKYNGTTLSLYSRIIGTDSIAASIGTPTADSNVIEAIGIDDSGIAVASGDGYPLGSIPVNGIQDDSAFYSTALADTRIGVHSIYPRNVIILRR